MINFTLFTLFIRILYSLLSSNLYTKENASGFQCNSLDIKYMKYIHACTHTHTHKNQLKPFLKYARCHIKDNNNNNFISGLFS